MLVLLVYTAQNLWPEFYLLSHFIYNSFTILIVYVLYCKYKDGTDEEADAAASAADIATAVPVTHRIP